jgi:large subunit ribosomal protein L4
MKYELYNQNAENIGNIDLPDNVFGLAMNGDLLYQVAISQSSNKRQVIAHAKGRAEVRGGGKKPWRQKGTGRARHGSIRSPIWKGGGVTFGPTKERNYKKKINKKMARKALLVALSSKAKDKELIVLDDIKLEKPKTKELAVILKNISKLTEKGSFSSALIVSSRISDEIKRASGNLQKIDILGAKDLNALTVLSHKNLILLKDSIDVIKGK